MRDAGHILDEPEQAITDLPPEEPPLFLRRITRLVLMLMVKSILGTVNTLGRKGLLAAEEVPDRAIPRGTGRQSWDAPCPICGLEKSVPAPNHSEALKSPENVLERFPDTKIGGYCDECGSPYPIGRRGKPRRFCSARCRKQSWVKSRKMVSKEEAI